MFFSYKYSKIIIESKSKEKSMAKYFLAVDIGASSGRHILGSVQDGKLVLEEVYRFTNGMTKKNGSLCWDTDALLASVIEGIKECSKLGKIPSYMAIDTWGVDFALLDGNGELIGDTVGYRDSRTDGMDKYVEELISDAELYAHTGIQKQVYNTIYQLMSLKVNKPEELERAEYLLMIPDYLGYRLTGVMHQEYTEASTTGLLDAKNGEWDMELIERLGYPKKLFGKLSMAGETVGQLKADIAEYVGYDLTVVHAPSHDTASAVLAVPAANDDFLYISSGTWSLMGTENPVANLGDKAREFNFTNEGGYDKRYRFLKNIMGLWIIQSIKREAEKYSFPELSVMARAVGDTEARIDVNDKAFLAPENMTEAIKKWCGRPDMPLDELLCCVYHSLAESYADTVRELEECYGVSYKSLHIVGGGSRDAFLNELTAHKCGLEVIAGPTEATAIGNIICQMLACKDIGSVKEARALVAYSFDVTHFN